MSEFDTEKIAEMVLGGSKVGFEVDGRRFRVIAVDQRWVPTERRPTEVGSLTCPLVKPDLSGIHARFGEFVKEGAEAYVSARKVGRQAEEDFREEALALARDHDRHADAYVLAIQECGARLDGPAGELRDLHRHTANFLRLVAEGRVNA